MIPGHANEIDAWRREAEQALNRRDWRRAHELCIAILARRPDFADAFFMLAMIAAAHDNHARAVDLIGRALALGPARAEYHAHLGRSLLALQQPRAAYEAAVRALQSGPSDALTLDTIGVVMTRAGAHAEAVDPFLQAVVRQPSRAAFQYNLGAALQFTGRFDEAAGAYRRALAADPGYFRAWSSLAQVSREPFTPDEVRHLEQQLDGPLDVDAELHLCHALAKHCEDRGEHARAFALLARGKQRKRSTIRYAFDVDQALFEAAIGDGVGRDTAACESAEPVFIVGMPRTGTTLVERILSSHPEVFAAGELAHLSLAVKRAVNTPSRHVLDADTLRAARHADLAGVGAAYLESTRPRTGHVRHFIDKMPLNFFYAGLIRRMLPNAKIICVRRHPLDTALGNYRQLFATGFSYYNYAYDLLDTGRYWLGFDRLARHWQETLGDNYCEVHYEDVVADTEAEARRLVAFLGLAWHSACLEFHRNPAPVATASSVQVRQPVYRTSVGRWRRYEREIAPLRQLYAEAGVNP